MLVYKHLGLTAEDLSANDEDEAGLYKAIIARNDFVRLRNEQAFYRQHPDLDPQCQAICTKEQKATNERANERVENAVPAHIGGQREGDDASLHALAMVTKTKMLHTVAQQSLYGATVTNVNSAKEVARRELSESFKDACIEPSFTAIMRAYRKSLVIFADSASRPCNYF